VNGTAEAYARDVGPVESEVGSDGDEEEEEAGAEEEDRCQVCALGGLGDGDAEGEESCVLFTGQLRSFDIETR
jgi:hypothetical protein